MMENKKVINETYLTNFIIDRANPNSVISFLKPNKDGSIKCIRQIKGKDAENLYDMIMEFGEIE